MKDATDKLLVVVKELQECVAPQIIQVMINKSRTHLWVNVDGVCRLRACRCGTISVLDDSQLR